MSKNKKRRYNLYINKKTNIFKGEINMLRKMRNKKGFTLIELIVVIAILGILAAVLIPRFTGFQNKARATEVLVAAKSVGTAIDGYEAEHGVYPDFTVAAELTDIETVSGVDGVNTDSSITAMDTDGTFTVSLTLPDTTVVTAGRTISGGVLSPVEMN